VASTGEAYRVRATRVEASPTALVDKIVRLSKDPQRPQRAVPGTKEASGVASAGGDAKRVSVRGAGGAESVDVYLQKATDCMRGLTRPLDAVESIREQVEQLEAGCLLVRGRLHREAGGVFERLDTADTDMGRRHV
jgi:hypothetical protein